MNHMKNYLSTFIFLIAFSKCVLSQNYSNVEICYNILYSRTELSENDSILLRAAIDKMQIIFNEGFEDNFDIYVNDKIIEKQISLKYNISSGNSYVVFVPLNYIDQTSFILKLVSKKKTIELLLMKERSCMITMYSLNHVKLTYSNGFIYNY